MSSHATGDPPRRWLTSKVWIHLGGGICACAWLWLAVRSDTPPVSLLDFFSVMTVTWLATLLVWQALRRRFAPDGSAQRGACEPTFPLRRIVLWGVAFRLIALLGAPILEDDPYRYLWDGFVFAEYGNPYLTAPADHFEDPTVPGPFAAILDHINHPDVPTIYGPVCQWAFRLAHALAPGALAPLRILLLLADLMTLWLLWRMGARRNLILYAWCPLLIKEVAFTAHVDALGIFFMLACLHAFGRRADASAAVLAAGAVASKLFAILILPWVFARMRWTNAWLFLGALTLLYLPFVVAGSSADALGLATFALGWEFNSSVHALLASLVDPQIARVVGLLGFTLFYVGFLWRGLWPIGSSAERSPFPGQVVFGVFFLLSPVANPWYLLWMLPFVTLQPSAWGLTALGVVSVSYAHGLYLPDAGLPPYHHPAWVRPLEVSAVGLALGVDVALRRRNLAAAPGTNPLRGEDPPARLASYS